MINDKILEIKDLKVEFNTFEGTSKVIDGISLFINKKEVIGLVGESGCGKSVTAKAILGILPTPPANITSGKILFNGLDLLVQPPKKSNKIRKKGLSFVPQDPTSSLNPLFSIEQQMNYMLKWKKVEKFSLIKFIKNSIGKEKYKKERETSIDFLKKVRITDTERVLKSYPFELSGGMRQRVFIAMALMSNPFLIIFDEPTTNLDVSVQEQILELIEDKINEQDNSILYITHDLGVAKRLCNRIYILYAGDVVETASVEQIFKVQKHPYTKDLLQSVPKIYGEMSKGIPGRIPNYYDPPNGCRFNPRCKYKRPICEKQKPSLKEIKSSPNHLVACHLIRGDGDE